MIVYLENSLKSYWQLQDVEDEAQMKKAAAARG